MPAWLASLGRHQLKAPLGQFLESCEQRRTRSLLASDKQAVLVSRHQLSRVRTLNRKRKTVITTEEV